MPAVQPGAAPRGAAARVAAPVAAPVAALAAIGTSGLRAHNRRVHYRSDDAQPWNVVAIARDRVIGKALARLRGHGEFRTTGYPRVLVGEVGDPRAFAGEAAADEASWSSLVQKLIPIDHSSVFERDDVTENLCVALAGVGPRLAGRSFYVRARLRGMKGRLEHPAVERALGAFLVDRAAAAGEPAAVRFSDVDFVVAVEVVGARAGYALLDREMRASPLLHVR